nr:MAG TPA: hypothetical protein [Caudoviricetes sp.]
MMFGLKYLRGLFDSVLLLQLKYSIMNRML